MKICAKITIAATTLALTIAMIALLAALSLSKLSPATPPSPGWSEKQNLATSISRERCRIVDELWRQEKMDGIDRSKERQEVSHKADLHIREILSR